MFIFLVTLFLSSKSRLGSFFVFGNGKKNKQCEATSRNEKFRPRRRESLSFFPGQELSRFLTRETFPFCNFFYSSYKAAVNCQQKQRANMSTVKTSKRHFPTLTSIHSCNSEVFLPFFPTLLLLWLPFSGGKIALHSLSVYVYLSSPEAPACLHTFQRLEE